MPDTFKYDVFLSHNHADKPRVRRLAERLRAAGVQVWLDEWVIQAGDNIALKVDEGLEQSRVLLLCISPAALASRWVALERGTAVHRDPANAGRRFIPVLLGECALPDTLRRYKYVDFRTESDSALSELLAVCRSESTGALAPVAKPVLSRRRAKLVTSEAQRKPVAELERMMPGHQRQINCVAISPNSELLASASDDNTVRVWTLKEGGSVFEFKRHGGNVTGVCFSKDGRWLFSTSKDSNVFVIDAKSGVQKGRLNGHISTVNGVFALPDGKRILTWSGGGENALKLWDWEEEECIRTMTAHEFRVESAAASPDGRHAIAASADGSITYWDLDTGKLISRFSGHTESVLSVHITSDGKYAVSSSEDKTIKIWDLRTSACVGTLEGHLNKYGLRIAISPDNRMIASVGYHDGTIRLWDFNSGTCVQVIQHRGTTLPSSVAFSSDGLYLAVGTAGALPFFIYVYRITHEKGVVPEANSRRYVNAKVVLLGDGTVGKTSLAHRMITDRYVVQDRTHGMNVWRLDLPLKADATLEREALLWDLAGQEDYRLIHRLFLEQTALALLLINPQKDDPFAEAGDWLKALKTSAVDGEVKRDTPRLLIFSQIDVGGMKLGSAKIDRFCEQHGFAHWLSTSAKTGENCSDSGNGGQPSKLKRLIAASITWDKLPWTTTPRLLAELKNAVMAMRDESDIRLLRYSELAQRLEQALPGEKVGDSELRTAVTLLANHGLARSLKFGDLVLLRPDLINGYAGAVIRAARAHTDEIGCVPEADIYRPSFDFTGVERLKHRPDEELLLRALVQTFLDHSLCIAEDTPHGRHLVFPSQYRREKDIPHDPEVFVSYTFSGEWQTVWTTLVVRLWYSQEFKHRELWRNAAEFESSRKRTLGLKIEKLGNGAATISLYFDHGLSDELKVIFIEYVHRHLAKYACEITRDRRYVCPDCGRAVRDLDAVRRRRDASKDFITCQECDSKVPFIDFIEQTLKSDPVAQKILAMDETATRELDAQALEQILIGHMMAIAGEANQIFRPVTMFDHGIDGEVEFKDNDGRASGKRIYIQLKSGNSYLRTRKADGKEVFDVSNDRHLSYWIGQPVDVYLVVRQTDELGGQHTIRWMNVTRYLKSRDDKESRQIVFCGEKLDMEAVWKVRDEFFPPD